VGPYGRGARVVADLERKAAGLVADMGAVSFAVGARNEVVHAPSGTLVVTAADVFAPDSMPSMPET
jgi:hypothetical protein